MGRLAGFAYRDIVRRLKELGLEFHRQAAGSHEIWFDPDNNRYATIPNHPGDMPEGALRAILVNEARSLSGGLSRVTPSQDGRTPSERVAGIDRNRTAAGGGASQPSR